MILHTGKKQKMKGIITLNRDPTYRKKIKDERQNTVESLSYIQKKKTQIKSKIKIVEGTSKNIFQHTGL